MLSEGLLTISNNAFNGCASLTEVTYNDTVEKWNALSKNNACLEGTSVTVVHCSDGDVVIE